MQQQFTRRALLGVLGAGGATAMTGTAIGTPTKGNGNAKKGNGNRPKDNGNGDATFVAPLTAGQSTKVKTSDGKGFARLTYDEAAHELSYRIEYEGDLEITQIHIHHAEPQRVDNRLVVFLKKYTENTDGPRPDEDASPVTPPRTVTGTVNEYDDLKTEDPAVAGGSDDIDEIIDEIIRDPGAFQINTHTVRSPGGEIRGQLRGAPVQSD